MEELYISYLENYLDKNFYMSISTPLSKFCEDLKLKKDETIMVELGSSQGHSAFTFSKYVKTLYCVDQWRGNPLIVDCNEKIFDKMCLLRDNIIKIKMNTLEAFKYFKDESIDILYIDADHSYSSVILDIMNWVPKIKWGGILSGHDYIPNETRDRYERKSTNGDVFEVIRDIFEDNVIMHEELNWHIYKTKDNKYFQQIQSPSAYVKS